MNEFVDEVKRSAAKATQATGQAAGTAKSGILDAVSKLAEVYASVRSFGVDDLLGRVGLSRKPGPLAGVGYFASGFVVGAGIGTLFAPMSGSDLRKRMARAVGELFSAAPRQSGASDAPTITPSQIKPNAPVVGANDAVIGVVDHVEAESIKLDKDASGQHHYIPMSWVKSIDDKVHVDRPGDQVMREWTTSPHNHHGA